MIEMNYLIKYNRIFHVIYFGIMTKTHEPRSALCGKLIRLKKETHEIQYKLHGLDSDDD